MLWVKGFGWEQLANLFCCKVLLDTLNFCVANPVLDFQFQVVEIIWERSFIVKDINLKSNLKQINEINAHYIVALQCLVL